MAVSGQMGLDAGRRLAPPLARDRTAGAGPQRTHGDVRAQAAERLAAGAGGMKGRSIRNARVSWMMATAHSTVTQQA